MEYNSFKNEPKIWVNLKDKKKPYVLLNNVEYLSSMFDDGIAYLIRINKKYAYDGASVPRFFWRLIGSKGEVEFLAAALIHDWLCENKDFIIQDGVKISSLIFRDILVLSGVSKFKANIMMSAVWAFQITRKGWN